jgi:hypothetical protein
VGALRSIVFLFIFTALIGAGNLLWTAHEAQVTAAGQARARQVADQRWCHLLGLLTPAGAPKPKTAFGREFDSALLGLRTDFRCLQVAGVNPRREFPVLAGPVRPDVIGGVLRAAESDPAALGTLGPPRQLGMGPYPGRGETLGDGVQARRGILAVGPRAPDTLGVRVTIQPGHGKLLTDTGH